MSAHRAPGVCSVRSDDGTGVRICGRRARRGICPRHIRQLAGTNAGRAVLARRGIELPRPRPRGPVWS